MHYGGSTRLTTTNSGVTIAGTATASNFILSSDRTLKDKISDLRIFSDKDIDSVPLKEFVFKSEPDRLRYGVIAQELEELCPDMVYRSENGKLQVSYFDFLIAKLAKKDKQIDSFNKRIYGLEQVILNI